MAGASPKKPAEITVAQRDAFCQAFSVSFNAAEAARKAGIPATAAKMFGKRMLDDPAAIARIVEIVNARAKELHDEGYDVIAKVREVVDRCMQGTPVYRKGGERVEGALWMFDAASALRGLELLGKQQGMFIGKFDITVNEAKAREAIKRALEIVATHVKPETFRKIVADLEAAGDA